MKTLIVTLYILESWLDFQVGWEECEESFEDQMWGIKRKRAETSPQNNKY